MNTVFETSDQLSFDGPEENSYARLRRISNMDKEQVSKSLYAVQHEERSKRISFVPVIAPIVFGIFYMIPFWSKYPTANSCLAILMTAAYCWATEFIPSYATALMVPAIAVWLHVGYNKETGHRIPIDEYAIDLAHQFMDPIIFVFLGSLTISAALSKLAITDRVSAFIMSHIPPKPRVVLITLMVLNYCIAAFLSNVASTTLVLTFCLPIIRSLDPDDPFITALLFGICWSGNIGGMATPISSPQNIIANTFLSKNGGVSFMTWCGFAIPTSLIILALFWVYLIFRYPTKPGQTLPPFQRIEFAPWSWRHSFAVLVTVVTIILWAIKDQMKDILGHNGITSMIPVVLFFSVGILDSTDFGALRWSTLILMGGGLAMGEAMSTSGLLDLIGDVIANSLKSLKFWVVLFIMLIILSILTSVISHTSAAAILFPVLLTIGNIIGGTKTLLLLSALMISGAQLFHISSFPNALISGVPRHLRLDPSKLTSESFLSGKDFLLVGWPTVLVAVLILSSVGYGIVKAMGIN